jgi:hypothetical protein
VVCKELFLQKEYLLLWSSTSAVVLLQVTAQANLPSEQEMASIKGELTG